MAAIRQGRHCAWVPAYTTARDNCGVTESDILSLLRLPAIADADDSAQAQRLQQLLDNKTKPPGSLGRIEQLAQQLGLILASEAPVLQAPQMLVCAADHGLAAQGVSAFPQEVTRQMVENFLAGGAAVSVLARQHGIALTVVDCGVAHDFGGDRPGLRVRKAAAGAADASLGPAMAAAQCAEAIGHGMDLVRDLPGNALLLGEMGIGNSSAAALLTARLTGHDVAACTGSGTGMAGTALAHKLRVLQAVYLRHAHARTPLAALAAFGGLEIATLVGVLLQGARERRVLVVDGFITTAAVLVAQALAPAVRGYCVFSHLSGERGHAIALAHLGVRPLLDLGLRLGEGSGAALAWPLLQSASLLLREMASFSGAGVSNRGELAV
ncbi:nicotinate-nucleotide-dimethylbenzimidazole phosphoribosyltransferase [Pseudorhodoferax soli]|uniref:Nicotinate-nucleotide--dimethylbenzimidazole phosphoribosyltransferase n=1 Tax=Pseudorhodoferax soli TaxID=545864 RepID=A0A368X891_9BURK|nr:nicotinate-nucleotide-dimethylbenzimidazole phosphoribosyltransferase [Pseudorhodoferax soli]